MIHYQLSNQIILWLLTNFTWQIFLTSISKSLDILTSLQALFNAELNIMSDLPVESQMSKRSRLNCFLWILKSQLEQMVQLFFKKNCSFNLSILFILNILPGEIKTNLTDIASSSLDEPNVMIDGFDGNWYLNRENVQLSCQADANPVVSLYQWRL